MSQTIRGQAPTLSDHGTFLQQQSALKILGSGTVTLTAPNASGSSVSETITHNLNFKPTVLAFVSFSPTGTRFPLPYLDVNLPTTGTIRYQVNYELVSDTQITFYHRDITAGTSVTDYITYYLCQLEA